MLKNLPSLSFRGASGCEESRKSSGSRARFLAAMKIAMETVVGPPLGAARPGQAPALQAPFSCNVVSRRIMESALRTTETRTSRGSQPNHGNVDTQAAWLQCPPRLRLAFRPELYCRKRRGQERVSRGQYLNYHRYPQDLDPARAEHSVDFTLYTFYGCA